MSNNALQCMVWREIFLCQIFQNSAPNPTHFNGPKQKLAGFLAAKNLTHLKQKVHFKIQWSDGAENKLTPNEGQYVILTFNIFSDNK